MKPVFQRSCKFSPCISRIDFTGIFLKDMTACFYQTFGSKITTISVLTSMILTIKIKITKMLMSAQRSIKRCNSTAKRIHFCWLIRFDCRWQKKRHNSTYFRHFFMSSWVIYYSYEQSRCIIPNVVDHSIIIIAHEKGNRMNGKNCICIHQKIHIYGILTWKMYSLL